MHLFAEASVNSTLIKLATDYLHTLDPEYFPFTAEFDDARREAFVRDLRIGLSDITESGAKRGTASVGRPTSDKRLQDVIRAWAEAEGGWPKEHDPSNPHGSVSIGTHYDQQQDEAPAGVEERN